MENEILCAYKKKKKKKNHKKKQHLQKAYMSRNMRKGTYGRAPNWSESS